MGADAEIKIELPNLDPEVRDSEVATATTFVSINGPCRGFGNVYLACVAKSCGALSTLREKFESCCNEYKEESLSNLKVIGTSICPEEEDKELCAALVINQQTMMQLEPNRNQ